MLERDSDSGVLGNRENCVSPPLSLVVQLFVRRAIWTARE